MAAVQPGMVRTGIGHCFTFLTSFLVCCLLSVRLCEGLGLWCSDIVVCYGVLSQKVTDKGEGGSNLCVCVCARARVRVVVVFRFVLLFF